MKTLQNEPVLTAGAIVGAIMATLTALIALGVITLDSAQLNAIQAALMALVSLALPVVGAVVARRYVTPVSNPRNNEGERLTPEEIYVP